VGPFYRYGENNFALLLIQTAKDLAERKKNELSKLIHETDWQKVTGHSVSLTAKFAVVSFPEEHRTNDELIAMALETLSDKAAAS
jgi:GGDEF domain-containing protein